MLREELIFVATCDVSGLVRGKGFPASDLPERLRKGVGWTHSCMMISPLGPIWDTPFGTAGDLTIVPDPTAEVRVDFGDGSAPEHFFLGDIRNTGGEPWECCSRDFLRRATTALAGEGLNLIAAFEQEFVYTGVEDRPGAGYSLGAFRRQGTFGETFIAAIREAGLVPDSFLPEYGPRQYEVTAAPAPALAAADQAIIVREMARATAWRLGHRVIFSPVWDPDIVGNGVHIHMSLRDAAGALVTYASGEPYGLALPVRRFFAGVLAHLPEICAITAPSPVSYLRLRPNRWAPTAANIAMQDRGAAIRVCPVFVADSETDRARQYNVEFRVCDATASPYLALGAIIFAGVDGLRRKLDLPPPADHPLDAMSEAQRAAAGIRALPASLGEALDALERSEAAREWFGATHLGAILRYKRAELANMGALDPTTLCARYAEVY